MNQASQIEEVVETLAGRIGERNFAHYPSLLRAAAYIKRHFEESGYRVLSQDYSVDEQLYTNLWVERPGRLHPASVILVGAHYDSIVGSPGANDNASSIAAVLSLARMFATRNLERTVRFVAFVNEEPPFFRSSQMGSFVYASLCAQEPIDIRAMICLDTIGYFSTEAGSQFNTLGKLPSVGDFIAVVAPEASSSLVGLLTENLATGDLRCLGLCADPSQVPYVNYSDHWPFIERGWPAVLVTDTGPLRYPYYHTSQDTPEKVNYAKVCSVVLGVASALSHLAGAS